MLDSERLVVRTQLAAHLVVFTCEGYAGDDIALDIIEHIALRMKTREDKTVHEVGTAVRTALIRYVVSELSFSDTLDHFTDLAMAAPVGAAELIETMHQHERPR